MTKPRYDFIGATFFFYKALGRRPAGALWIAIWQLLLYGAIAALALWALAPLWPIFLDAAATNSEPDEAEILRMLGSLSGFYLIVVAGSILAALMIQGAWLRLMTRDEIAAVIPIRFGGDELRLFGVNLVFIVFNAIAWLGVIILFGILNASVFAASGGDARAGTLIGAVLGNTILAGVVTVAAIVIMTRFAAAPALSVAQKRFRLFESFGATSGITGWMILSYLLLIAVAVGIFTVIAVVQQIVVLFAAADMIGALSALDGEEDPAVVFSILAETFSTPGALAALGVLIVSQLAAQILVEGAWHGVGAYAAARETGSALADGPEPVETPSASVGAAPAQG